MSTPFSTVEPANFVADWPPAVVAKSVYKECIEEENRHKWIESEKAGYDLGEGCIQRWVSEHWSGYLRARWVEHLQGKCFWVELDRGDFGLLQREFQDQQDLLESARYRLGSRFRHINRTRPPNPQSSRCQQPTINASIRANAIRG
jgi:hypothetical protein